MSMSFVFRVLIAAAVVTGANAAQSSEGAGTSAPTNGVAKKKVGKLTPEEFRARRRASEMKRFGGYLRKDGTASGKVVFLNAQRRIPAASLRRACEHIEDHVHPVWELKDVQGVKVSNPLADIRAAGGEIGVVIIDDPDLPALVTAPEVGWAEVNVGALTPFVENDDNLAARTRKEILRAFALIGGGAFMTRDPIVMRPDIRKPQELDLIGHEEYGLDVIMALERGLPLAGVKPWQVETYKKACEEGWAHSPTNDFQKRVWDKVHQLPTNPLPLVKPTK